MEFVIEAAGLRVTLERGWQAASLRYFHPAGGFVAAVREELGAALPLPLRAIEVERPMHDGPVILAWRSPTETLLLTMSPAGFAGLDQRLAAHQRLAAQTDGCLVDQTGGIRVLRVQGPRTADLMMRLGTPTAAPAAHAAHAAAPAAAAAHATIPGAGEARSSRLAELPVLTVCVREGELLLLVERVYADHLLAWIRATAADF